MQLYREWCLKPDQRRGCMLPVDRVEGFCNAPDAGYASVFMFQEQDAKEIIASRSSAGLARYPVYADTLTLDLDQGYDQLYAVLTKVSRFDHTVFESGGKGYHVVIPLASLVSGINVPYSQRCWVEALNVGADPSIYHAGHIISLPGRVHPKTGKRKVIVEHYPGDRLALPIIDPPPPTFAIRDDNQSELERGLWRVLALLQSEPGIGGRNTALWGAAKHLADAGLGYDSALDILWQVNQSWNEPKDLEGVTEAVRKAYRGRTT